MVVMNNVITRFEILERGTSCAWACSAWCATPSGEVGLGDEGDMCTWHISAKVHSGRCNINCGWQLWLFERADRVEQNNIGATLFQAFGEALARHVGIGENKYPVLFANEFSKARHNDAGIAREWAPPGSIEPRYCIVHFGITCRKQMKSRKLLSTCKHCIGVGMQAREIDFVSGLIQPAPCTC